HLDDDYEAIRDLWRDNNRSELLERVHKLHGATRYCGVPLLRNLAGTLESELKQDGANIQASVEGLLNEIERIRHWAEHHDWQTEFRTYDVITAKANTESFSSLRLIRTSCAPSACRRFRAASRKRISGLPLGSRRNSMCCQEMPSLIPVPNALDTASLAAKHLASIYSGRLLSRQRCCSASVRMRCTKRSPWRVQLARIRGTKTRSVPIPWITAGQLR